MPGANETRMVVETVRWPNWCNDFLGRDRIKIIGMPKNVKLQGLEKLRVTDYGDKNGNFKDWEALKKVPGIDGKMMRK